MEVAFCPRRFLFRLSIISCIARLSSRHHPSIHLIDHRHRILHIRFYLTQFTDHSCDPWSPRNNLLRTFVQRPGRAKEPCLPSHLLTILHPGLSSSLHQQTLYIHIHPLLHPLRTCIRTITSQDRTGSSRPRCG